MPFYRSLVGYLRSRGLGYESHLDVGCGLGDFLLASQEVGVRQLKGIDWADWLFKPLDELKAVLSAQDYDVMAKMRGIVGQFNATKMPFADRSFDLVSGIDLMEHIYIEDIPSVVLEMMRVAKKWILLKTCTARGDYEVYCQPKDAKVPLEQEWLVVSGHVTLQTDEWWDDLWEDGGWRINHDWGRKAQLEMHLADDWRSIRLLRLG